MGDANGDRVSGPRCIAIVGPFGGGKTTLLEAILARTGAVERQGSVQAGTSVGDRSAEAREQGMSVELNIAATRFMGDDYTFLDCPGSVEFLHDMRAALPVCDAAIVVCDADEKKGPALQLILKALEDLEIPRLVFVNKIDQAQERLRETLEMLQPASRVPLLMRQIPTFQNGIVTGFIDLALERAFVYREHAASEVVDMSDEDRAAEAGARFAMLEKLADYDDELMEQLLEELEPARDRVFDDLRRDLREGLLVPVLFGSAERGNGILRLMKALRHEVGGLAATRARLGLDADAAPMVQVLKTVHTAHGGKLSFARVLAGSLSDGSVLTGPSGAERIAGLHRPMGGDMVKAERAEPGEVVALGRLEKARTGDTLAADRAPPLQLVALAPAEPVLSLALSVKDRKDEVKLTSVMAKLTEEDPSLSLVAVPEFHEIRLRGQGEMHLRTAVAKLKAKYGLAVEATQPRVGYRETIRKPVTHRGRHKKQSGGHGQFGDVLVEIKPLPRGAGIVFESAITGGVVPRQYIGAVEAGAREGLGCGPLGFPVVDVSVTLVDGSYHTVDSSDQAFRMAGRLAVSEGLPKCSPVLLEPVLNVEIAVPSWSTARINAIVSSRRGQLLGYDARPDWPGWDLVQAQIPEAEIRDLIVEIRSATSGVGSFTARFDHLSELTGRLAEQVTASSAVAAA